VEKDGAEAIRWFRLAAEQGGALAQCNLGFAYYNSDETVEAAHWFGRAAEQGLAHAQHNLGICYSSGVGVPRDLGRAAELLQRAADQGHPGSQLAYEQTMNDILIMRSLLQSNIDDNN
jgi:TPR repeat protein